MSEGKLVSHLTVSGDSIVSDPVTPDAFVPNNSNLFPKFSHHIDHSCWELWQFDAISAHGDTAVSISFYRDTRTLEKGGFHVDINAIFPDGSKWGTMLLFEESTVTSGGQPGVMSGRKHQDTSASTTTGTWTSTVFKKTAKFSIAEDLSFAVVELDCPGSVTGTIHLTAPRTLAGGNTIGSDGRLPASDEEGLLAPSIYYLFPMGPASASVNLAFTDLHVRPGALKRIVCREDAAWGSLVRGWSALSFPQMLSDAYYVNAAMGPYMIQLIHIMASASAGGLPHTLVRLYRNNKLVFAAQGALSGAGSDSELHSNEIQVVVKKVMAGDPGPEGIAAVFSDKNIGRNIELTRKEEHVHGRRWLFQARHRRAWWSEPTSVQGLNGPGKSGFIETVSGGIEGEEPFQGSGLAGQLQIPLLSIV